MDKVANFLHQITPSSKIDKFSVLLIWLSLNFAKHPKINLNILYNLCIRLKFHRYNHDARA